jgi:hypothetical protein
VKRVTHDQLFERWWTKNAPNPEFVEMRRDRAMELIRDWSRAAFSNGYGVAQRVAKKRAKP